MTTLFAKSFVPFPPLAQWVQRLTCTFKSLQYFSKKKLILPKGYFVSSSLIPSAKDVNRLLISCGCEKFPIQKLSLANGKSLDDNVSSIMGGGAAFAAQNKLAINQKQILKDVNGMSASLKLSLEGGTEALGAAAAQARKFGINLEQAESIASSLLDFESSIENELSAELLIGRNLNLEKARGLALSGEATKAAAELLKQVGSSAEFGEMNVIQQEAIAKAMGMQREDLAASLIESEALKDIGAESAEEAREKYDTLRLTMSAEEAAAELGDKQLANQFEQQSVVERLSDVMSNLKEIFISIVDGPLGLLLKGLGEILSSTTAIFSITGLLAGLYAGEKMGIRSEPNISQISGFKIPK